MPSHRWFMALFGLFFLTVKGTASSPNGCGARGESASLGEGAAATTPVMLLPAIANLLRMGEKTAADGGNPWKKTWFEAAAGGFFQPPSRDG